MSRKTDEQTSNVKAIRVISQSNDGKRAEVIAEENGVRRTLHIHNNGGVWQYLVRFKLDEMILGTVDISTVR